MPTRMPLPLAYSHAPQVIAMLRVPAFYLGRVLGRGPLTGSNSEQVHELVEVLELREIFERDGDVADGDGAVSVLNGGVLGGGRDLGAEVPQRAAHVRAREAIGE